MQYNMPVGNLISGMPVSAHKFVGVASLNQLQNAGLRRPSLVEAIRPHETRDNEALREAKELRQLIQRSFMKARVARAESYATYIHAVESEGALGGTPPITIFAREAHYDPAQAGLVIPFSSNLIAIDGETQTEARFLLLHQDRASGDKPIAVTIWHDIPATHAKTILIHANKFVHPIKDREILAMDDVGRVVKTVEMAAVHAHLQPDMISRGGKKVKGTLVSRDRVSAAVVGWIMGERALSQNYMRWFEDINKQSLNPDKDCIQDVAEMIEAARQFPQLGAAHAAVWQASGVKAKTTKASPRRFKYENAIEMVKQLSGGPGNRVSQADRLAAAYQAL